MRSNFNTSYVTVQRIELKKYDQVEVFQYILCYGSTISCTHIYLSIKHFNTSYVTVQRPTMVVYPTDKLAFQYILCYGSTIKVLNGNQYLINFNTSYVTVQRLVTYFYSVSWKNFNTSYVTVQQILKSVIPTSENISIHPMLRFNFL